jgi:hypothetical protein
MVFLFIRFETLYKPYVEAGAACGLDNSPENLCFVE